MAKATMAKKPFRLSPNEEAAIIKKEKERRRKLRLQQVREQEKAFAQKLRKHAKDKREKEVRVLAENLQRHWLDDQVNKERGLEILYEKSLNSVGEGHRAADAQKTEEKEEIRLAICIHNEKIAAERHNEALRELQIQKNEQFQKENAQLMARKNALEIERARAAVMASLPPPPEDPLETLMKEDPTPPVKLTSADGFSTTLYHLPSGYVEKAEPHEQGDAKQAAVEEEERMKEETAEMERDAKERHQKAILRHKHAKEKVDLEQDFNQLMVDLGHLEQIDRRRRQKVLNKIPHKVFQPPHRRLEEKEERQQDLEQAFEDMYMAKTDYSGDLTLALEPKAPETDPALDLSADTEHLDKVATPIGSPKKADFPIGLDKDVSAAGPGVQDEAKQMDSTGADPKKESFQKLMNKIKTQREEWAQKSMQESTEVCVDKKPEKIQLADMHTDAEKPEREADAWAPEQDGLQPDSQPQPSTADSLPPMAQQTQGGDGTADAISDEPILAGSNTLLHPYEQASLIRSKQVTELEQRQEEQRRMMEIQELQRRQLEEQILRDRIAQQELQQMLEENRQKILQSKERLSSKFGGHQAPLTSNQADALRRQDEEEQRRKIHEHQQKLLQQQRQSKQGLSEAKARLQRNREMLMQKYPQVRLPSEPYQPAPIQQPHPSGFFPPPMPPQMGYTSIPSQYPAVHPQQGFFQLPVQFHPPPSADPMRTPQVHTSMGPPSSVAMQAVPTEFVPQSQGLATHAQHEAAKHDVQVGRDISMERQLPKESPAVEDALATSEQDISLSSHGIKSQGIHAKRQEQLAKQKEFLERQREGLLRQQAEQQRRMNERQQQLQAEINRQQEELELAQRLARESEEAKARSKLQRGPPPVQSLPPSESVHPHELSTIEEADISRDSEGRPVSRLGDAEAISAAEQPQTAARDDVPSYAQDVGKGILSYPSYTKMPSTSKDAGSAGISVTTDGRFTLSSFHQPLFPKVSQDDSVSSGSIVSDSITSGEIDSTPLYPSSAVKATAFSGRLPAHQEESEDAGQFSRAPLHRDWSATDSRPLDPVFLQRSKAFASDSDTSPESTKFFPLPKSSGSTNESESQEKKDGAAMTTASTTTMGTKLKDRMLKSLSHIPSSSSDEETGTKSRFDSRIQTSDRSDDSDGSFRPLPEALSEYSLSTPGQPSPLKSLLSVQQSLDRQTLESSTSSYQQKSLTFSPSKGGRPMYTTSSLGDTLSEHSLPTQDSYRFSPSKSRTRESPLSDIKSLEWSGRSSEPSRSRLESGFSSFKWRDALKTDSLYSPETTTQSLVKESSPPGKFRGSLSMSPLKEKEDFKPPNSSPSTPEHEESKFAEFASPMKSKGRDGHVQSRLDSTKKDDTQSGKIVIEKPTSRWEYASSSDEDIENLRANSSHSSSIPLASDASLLSQHETEGSTSGSIVKNSPLPKYMQLHSPIKPTLENLECVSKSPMKAQDFFSHAGAIPNIPDPGNLSTDPTETPVIIDSVSNVQVPDLSDGESHSQGTTMTRYDRLIEESRRLREKHQRQDEAEQKRLAMLNTRYQEIKEALEQPVLEEEEMREEDDSKESGIMEEPDLTLISIETSSVASTEDIAESLMSFEQHEKQLVAESMMMKDAASLMSFEQHEKQLVAESMMMKEAKDDGDYDTISSGTLADSPHSEGTMESGTVIPLRIPIKQDSEQVSLQEAFAKRKQAFIEASKRREKEAKEKAMQSAHEIDVKILKKTTKPTGQNGKQTDKESSVEGKKSVKFSPMPEILSKPHESPVKKPTKAIMKTKTSSDRKKDEIEMKQRNLRLYNQLEEVKERKVLEERKDSYAQNREKAKEFQKKTLEMLKKKSTKAKKAT